VPLLIFIGIIALALHGLVVPVDGWNSPGCSEKCGQGGTDEVCLDTCTVNQDNFENRPHVYTIRHAIAYFRETGRSNWADFLEKKENFNALATGVTYADYYKGRVTAYARANFLGFDLGKQGKQDAGPYAAYEHYYDPETGKGLDFTLQGAYDVRDKYLAQFYKDPKVIAFNVVGSAFTGHPLVTGSIESDPNILGRKWPSALYGADYRYQLAKNAMITDENPGLKAWLEKEGEDLTSIQFTTLGEAGHSLHFLQDVCFYGHLKPADFSLFYDHGWVEDIGDTLGNDKECRITSANTPDSAIPDSTTSVSTLAKEAAEATLKEYTSLSSDPGFDSKDTEDQKTILRKEISRTELYTVAFFEKLLTDMDIAPSTLQSPVVENAALILGANPAELSPGESTTFNGILRNANPVGNRKILLSSFPSGSWGAGDSEVIATLTTDASGSFSFPYTPAKTSYYAATAISGDSTAFAHSDMVKVSVLRATTIKTPAITPTIPTTTETIREVTMTPTTWPMARVPPSLSIGASPDSVQSGRSTVLQGVLMNIDPATGQQILIGRYHRDVSVGWIRDELIATLTTDESGRYSYTYTPAESASYQATAVRADSSVIATSPMVAVSVNQPATEAPQVVETPTTSEVEPITTTPTTIPTVGVTTTITTEAPALIITPRILPVNETPNVTSPTPTPSFADLAVTGIVIIPNEPVAYEDFEGMVTVMNLGQTSSGEYDIAVILKDPQGKTRSFPVDRQEPLIPGAEATIPVVELSMNAVGKCEMRVEIKPIQFTDGKAENNVMTKKFSAVFSE
jgi:hypothetical protein